MAKLIIDGVPMVSQRQASMYSLFFLGKDLGQKRNLRAFVVDPGFSQTNLGTHIGWAKEVGGMSQYYIRLDIMKAMLILPSGC